MLNSFPNIVIIIPISSSNSHCLSLLYQFLQSVPAKLLYTIDIQYFCCIFCNNLSSQICERLLFYSKITLNNSLRKGGGSIQNQHSKYKYELFQNIKRLTSVPLKVLPLKDSIQIQNWSLIFGKLLEMENTPHHYYLSLLLLFHVVVLWFWFQEQTL